MPNIKIQREAIYKDSADYPVPYLKCGGILEQANLPYMIATRTGSRMENSFLAPAHVHVVTLLSNGNSYQYDANPLQRVFRGAAAA